MSRNFVLFIIMVLACGSVVTLISGLYPQDLSYGLGVSVTGYGLPLSWLKKSTIIYTGDAARYGFYLESFLLDMSFWSLIVGVTITVISHFLKQKKEQLE
jgi:hypothetical protein